MDALPAPGRWDWRRERAWGALSALLEAHPEGVANIAALDRLTEYGLREREAMQLLDEMRESGRVVMANGRWTMR